LGIPPLEENVVEITISAPTLICGMLPELSEESLEDATSLNQRQWIYGLMALGSGYTHVDDCGVTLQVIDNRTVRCISVCNDDYSLETLAMIKYAFESEDFTIQIDPYAILREVPSPNELKQRRQDSAEENVSPNGSTIEVESSGMEIA